MPKLPRTWIRGSQNFLNTRDGNLYLTPTILPGQSVERVWFCFRIYGRMNESDLEVPFDAYYVGVQYRDANQLIPAGSAWTERDTADWLWWEGAHFRPVMGVGTPGQAWIFYPSDDDRRDTRAKRTNNTATNFSLAFSFARSGGAVLTEQRVNVNFSLLLLG